MVAGGGHGSRSRGEAVERLREQAEELGGAEPASARAEVRAGRRRGEDGGRHRRGRSHRAVRRRRRAGRGHSGEGGCLRLPDRASCGPLLISGGIAIALAILVGWALGAWMTRPLRRLSAAARGMAGGSYEQPVTGSYPGEIQELADSLETMRQEVRRSEDSLRGFVSSAAHELRTPLTSIQGFSQALLDGTAATAEERSRSAAAIYRESTRLRRLVDALLTLSRYDSHEFQPNMTPVAVDDLVREEVERLVQAGLVEPGRIAVQVEGDARVVTDGDMLRQVIANLLHNAVQYGGADPVTVRLWTRDRRAARSRWPTGASRSRRRREARIFSRFYRGRAGRQTEGFGLGLALVWEICDVLGGRVELVEGGPLTRFRVTLPVGPRAAAALRTGRQGGQGAERRVLPYVADALASNREVRVRISLHRTCRSGLSRIQLHQAAPAGSPSSWRPDDRARSRGPHLRREPERGRLGRRPLGRSGGHLDHHLHRRPGLSLRADGCETRASRWSWAGRT